MQKRDQSFVREDNQKLILNLLQSHVLISRKEIAQISGLSGAAVTKITSELIASGLVYETGEAEDDKGVGRRRVLLRLNHAAGFVVGVKLTEHTVFCAIVDIESKVIYHNAMPVPVANQWITKREPLDPETLINTAIQAIELGIAAAGVDRIRLLGIGVAINGIVDNARKVCRFAPHFGWKNVPVSGPLETHFKVPVCLDDDVKTIAIAEQRFGRGRGAQHFAVVAVGIGVGAGIIANGQAYGGALGGAGQFGHTVLLPNGPLCSCGKLGCVEALASEPAVIRELQKVLLSGIESVLTTRTPLNFETIAEAATEGDVVAQQVLTDAGNWLGRGVANLINVINPQRIICVGEGVRAGHWYWDAMWQTAGAFTFDDMAQETELIIDQGEAEAGPTVAWGAACVALNQLFSAPHYMQQQLANMLLAARSV